MNNPRHKRVAVTGATGMLGSRVVTELVGAGYTDIVLPVRNIRKTDVLRRTFARAGMVYDDEPLWISEVQLTDTARLTELFDGCDTVFNCAAKVSMEGANPQDIIENNVSITRSVAEAALQSKVKRFVHVSSIAALGDAREGEMLIDEECPVLNPKEFSPYGQSKQAAERVVWEVAERGLGVTVVLPSVILGEGDWNGLGSASIVRLAASGLPFATSGVVGYVDVCDVARAMRILAETPEAEGQRFILSAANLSYKELMTRGAEAAGRRKPFITLGSKAMGAAWRMAALLKRLHIADTSLTKAAATSATEKSFYDGTKIEKYCNFEYSFTGDTIARVVGAYIEERNK